MINCRAYQYPRHTIHCHWYTLVPRKYHGLSASCVGHLKCAILTAIRSIFLDRQYGAKRHLLFRNLCIYSPDSTKAKDRLDPKTHANLHGIKYKL